MRPGGRDTALTRPRWGDGHRAGHRHVQLARPVYPYPEQVKYSGTGDPNLAASYVPVAPSVPHQDDYRWAG